MKITFLLSLTLKIIPFYHFRGCNVDLHSPPARLNESRLIVRCKIEIVFRSVLSCGAFFHCNMTHISEVGPDATTSLAGTDLCTVGDNKSCQNTRRRLCNTPHVGCTPQTLIAFVGCVCWYYGRLGLMPDPWYWFLGGTTVWTTRGG